MDMNVGNIPWKSSMGACSGWGVAWSLSGRLCSDILGPSRCSPLRWDSSSSSSTILLFSLTQLGQNEVEASALVVLFSSSFSSTFRSETLRPSSEESSLDPEDAVLHSPPEKQGWDLAESSREASRTSLKIRSIFFLLAGGWPSGSSLGCLLGLGLACAADCRHRDLKSLWSLGRIVFPVPAIKPFY